MFVEKIVADRILFSTDFLWFNHHYYIDAVSGSEILKEDCKKIFYLNTA